MLIVALIYCGIVILACYLTVHFAWPHYLGSFVFLFSIGVLFAFLNAPLFYLLSTSCLLVAASLCCWRKAKPFTYLINSLLAAVLSFLALYVHERSDWGEVGQARVSYPIESLENRLAYEQKETERKNRTSPRFDENRLNSLEGEIYFESRKSGAFEREGALWRIHEDSVNHFVNSPGFGVIRGLPPKTIVPLPEIQSIPLPGTKDEYFDQLKDGRPRIPTPDKAESAENGSIWEELHHQSVLDFVHPLGLGYVKGRGQVRGFQPHHFQQLPLTSQKGTNEWQVRELALVSLLKFERPRVYVSRNLPRMDELANAPTRALDAFEQKGLEILQKGEELAIASSPVRIRVMGSLRATKQCLKCHEVERGELLGAFTYIFDRETKTP